MNPSVLVMVDGCEGGNSFLMAALAVATSKRLPRFEGVKRDSMRPFKFTPVAVMA